MRLFKILAPIVTALIFSITTSSMVARAYAGQTTRVSVASVTGEPANMAAGQGALSANGRYVAFSSAATNLGTVFPGTLNTFRYDRATRETVVVNVNRFGSASAGSGFSPTVSADGRYVAFASAASDLVVGDDNALPDVFWRDMDAGVTKLVSVNADGVRSNGVSGFSGNAGAHAISDDGRYVVFNSAATSLVPGANGKQQVYLKDMTTGGLVRVSVDATGAAGNDNSSFAVISGDGTTVAFRSESTNFSDQTVTASSQIFVRDLVAATTTLESVTSDEVVNLLRPSSAPALSFDGKFVAFESLARLDARDLDNGGALDIFLRDRAAGTTVLASLSANPVAGAPSRNATVSGDGRYVGFNSLDDKLVPLDAGGLTDVFVYDRLTEVVTLVSRNDAGDQANAGSFAPSLSYDGGLVAFQSTGSNLGSTSTTLAQIYVRLLSANQAPVVNAGTDESVLEGTWVHHEASFSDADGSKSWTATADFGAGPFDILLDQNKKLWIAHEPLTPGSYAVTISVTDDAGATGTATFNYTVTNVAPSADLGAEAFVYFGATFQRTVCLADPDRLVPHPTETYTATVRYGDGTPASSAQMDGACFDLAHTYASAGNYVITVTAADSNGGTRTQTLAVHVYNYSFEWQGLVSDTFVVGRNLPVKFSVRAADGSPVQDRSVVVDVIDAAGTVVAGPYTFGDQPSRSVTWNNDSYHVNVDTKGVSAGMYWLRVRFSSATLSGEFTLATTGSATALRPRLRD